VASSRLLVVLTLAAGLLLGPVAPAPARPETARRADPVTVVAVGDIACEPGDKPTSDSCRQAATARLAAKVGPDAVLALGDTQYERGAFKAYQHSYDASWGALKDLTYAVPGNHEYGTAGAKGFYRYFGIGSPGYRVATLGAWRVYLLNSNCDAIDCAAERSWLESDLAAHPVTCSAIAMHFPRYSSGQHGSDPGLKGFWRIARRHGVDLALAGHDHDYERFAPMDAAGHVDKARGIVSFVAGTGGRSLYSRDSHPRGSRYFANDRFGVLVLTLADTRMSWEFRAVGGGVRDAGSRACH